MMYVDNVSGRYSSNVLTGTATEGLCNTLQISLLSSITVGSVVQNIIFDECEHSTMQRSLN